MSEMASSPAFCANCGAALRLGVGFCAACGHNVARVATPAAIPPPPPVMIPPPPPPAFMPPMYVLAPAPKAKHGWGSWGTGKKLAYVFVLMPVLFVGIFALIMVISTATRPTASDNTPNYLLAPIDFTTDYNAMIVIDNADIIQQNSQDATTSIAGLQARVAAHKNFDNQVARLVFAPSAQSDQQKVLDTDNALEQSLTQLAANRSNTTNYNAVLKTEQPLNDAFIAAVTQLTKD